MKNTTLIIAGLSSFLLTSLTQLPAALLMKVLPQSLTSPIQGVSGSLWQGSANVVTIQGLPLRNVRWTLHASNLLKGQIAAHILANPAPGGMLEGDCAINWRKTLNCTDMKLSDIPVQVLTPYVQRLMIPPLSGTLQADLTSVVVEQNTLPQINGRVEWQSAGVQLASQRFGNYTAQLTPTANNDLRIILGSAADAAFAVDGMVNLQANGQYQSNISLKPTSPLEPMVSQVLGTFMGPAQPDGSYKVSQQGKLPF